MDIYSIWNIALFVAGIAAACAVGTAIYTVYMSHLSDRLIYQVSQLEKGDVVVIGRTDWRFNRQIVRITSDRRTFLHILLDSKDGSQTADLVFAEQELNTTVDLWKPRPAVPTVRDGEVVIGGVNGNVYRHTSTRTYMAYSTEGTRGIVNVLNKYVKRGDRKSAIIIESHADSDEQRAYAVQSIPIRRVVPTGK